MISNSPFSPGKFGGQSLSSVEPVIPSSIVRKIFEGSKNLWRQRFLVDIIIFLHEKLPSIRSPSTSEYRPFCIELVVFNPRIGAEAPHLYLSYSKLCRKFERNEEDFHEKTEWRPNYIEDLIVNFVLNRVAIITNPNESDQISCKAEESSFEIFLTMLQDDAGDHITEISQNKMSTV